jgi:hypothetical protein
MYLLIYKMYFPTPSSDVLVSSAFGVGQRAACCEQGAQVCIDFVLFIKTHSLSLSTLSFLTLLGSQASRVLEEGERSYGTG